MRVLAQDTAQQCAALRRCAGRKRACTKLASGRAARCAASSGEAPGWAQRVEKLQMSALDKAVGVVNGALSIASKPSAVGDGVEAQTTASHPPTTPRASRGRQRVAGLSSMDETLGDGGTASPVARAAAAGEPLLLKAKTSVSRPLQEIEGRLIAEYLAMPVDEYNMLDDSIVERLPGEEQRFRLTFPFREWFRINLEPQVVLHVRPDAEHARVMFICERLQFGNAVMDENSDITFTTAVSRQLPVRSGQDANLVAAMQLKAVLTPPKRAGKALSSRALAAVANRLLTTVLAASTRPFLDALVRDYEDWAMGRERKPETIDAQDMNAMLRKSASESGMLG